MGGDADWLVDDDDVVIVVHDRHSRDRLGDDLERGAHRASIEDDLEQVSGVDPVGLGNGASVDAHGPLCCQVGAACARDAEESGESGIDPFALEPVGDGHQSDVTHGVSHPVSSRAA